MPWRALTAAPSARNTCILWIRANSPGCSIESARGKPQFDEQQKQRILERLIAEGLEKYLHRRCPGTKRFGLEGGESLIPMLHELLQRLGTHGIRESVVRWRIEVGSMFW